MNDTSRQMGKNAEQSFVDCFTSNGHTCVKSTRYQDMREHWDFLVDGQYKIEVKARKKARRHDSSPNDEWIYVEFRNVIGKEGWLYGKADYFAFERPDGFLIVPRTVLVECAEDLIDNEWADRPTPYKSYRRRDRLYERVGVLLISDVLALPNRLVVKK